MAEELRPCPFCGRSDTMCFSNNHEECDDDIDVPTMYIVVCSVHDGGCGGHSGYYETKLEAAAAWNRRAERTCNVECYPPGYEDNLHYEVCSECGTILTSMRPGDRHSKRANYCPSCGALVIGEETRNAD